MMITTMIERIFMVLSGILMIGYILVDLHVKKKMEEASEKLMYGFAYRYALIRTGCIFGFMGAIAFTWNFSDYWEGISLPLLILHGIFNLALLMALIVIYGSAAKLNKDYKNEKYLNQLRQESKWGPREPLPGEPVYERPTQEEIFTMLYNDTIRHRREYEENQK